jgi:hypothetical protein
MTTTTTTTTTTTAAVAAAAAAAAAAVAVTTTSSTASDYEIMTKEVARSHSFIRLVRCVALFLMLHQVQLTVRDDRVLRDEDTGRSRNPFSWE